MKSRLLLLAIALLAVGWFLYHYLEYRSCGERSCSPSEGGTVLRLESGREVAVLSTHVYDSRDLIIDYLTVHDREDLRALCDEARQVWAAASEMLDMRRLDRAVLSPTSPESEFLGMKFLVVPLYTCCISTHLKIEKDRAGRWVLPDCPD